MKLARSLLIVGLLAAPAWGAAEVTADPLQSSMWDYFHLRMLEQQPYVFDAQVQVSVPAFAEDSAQVPIEVDARALTGKVQKMIIWAELNPIPKILSLNVVQPDQVENFLAVRIRVEQATPIRAALLMDDGLWHVGSAWIDAAGGGCTMPSTLQAKAGWEKNLGQVLGARFEVGSHSRLRLTIAHPMDNGLNSAIPEFYLNQAELRTARGEVLADLELLAALSENPTLTLGLTQHQATELWLSDNNGNQFLAHLP